MSNHPDIARESVTERRTVLVPIGKAIRAARRAAGFSQEAFADACEIDRSYMGGVERGVRNLSTANLMHIIQALGMKPSAFFQLVEQGAEHEPVKN